MKKRIFALLLSLTMVLGILPAGTLAAGELPYSDLEPNAWYTEAVRYAHETGMMKGTGDGLFSPNATTTRSTVVTLLHRVEKTPEAKGEPFSDVVKGSWYAGAVAWASANGIVNGMGDGTFHPDDVITREQFAAILYRYAKFKGVDVSQKASLTQFTDADKISPFAKEAMAWAVEVGLISGLGNGLLDPLGGATRAQAAAILMRYETKVAPAPAPTATPTPTPKTTKKPGGGSGGGGGGSSGGGSDPEPAKTALSSVTITRGGTAVTGTVAIGDELSLAVEPEAATYDAEWTVTNYTYTNAQDTKMVISAEVYAEYKEKTYITEEGESAAYTVSEDTRIVGTGSAYTVSVADASGKIAVKVAGKGDYTGTKAAAVDVKATRAFIAAGEMVARVSVAETAAYKDEEGNELEVTAHSVLSLTIEKKEEAVTESQMGVGSNAQAKKASLLRVIEKSAGAQDGSLAADTDLSAAAYANVAVELKLDEEPVQPVGETVVLLSAQELGISEGADLNDYVFFAQHTNVDDETELDSGKVVAVEGKQYVQFTLNGLSRVWIGNVPPRTVTFDAAGGAPTPAAQKVKFGGYAKYVEPPVRSGYLFAGWDHDMKTQNVIVDLTVTALWVEGQTAADDQLTGTWAPVAPEADSYTETKKDGKLTLTFARKEGYAADLSYTLTMAPPAGAVKFAAASTVEGALAATGYKTIAGNEAGLSITQAVTDAQGVPVDSSTNLYIKWADADGKPILLQSMTLTVGNAENYDTKTRKETLDVDRGLGRVSAYLTGGKASVKIDGVETIKALPDFEGTVNGYPQRRTVNGENQLYLDLYFSFHESFYDLPELPNTQVDDRNYSGIKLVISPFEGKSFSGVPAVTAIYRDANGVEDVRLEANVTLDQGNVVVTSPKPPVGRYSTYVYYQLTLDGKTQDISVQWSNHSANNSKNAETWAQVLELFAADENAHVRYTGTEDITLTQPLTLKPSQNLYFSNSTKAVTMTIERGGALTLAGDDRSGAYLDLGDGSMVVADGGILAANSQSSDQTDFYHSSVYGRNDSKIIVEKGGRIQVPVYGYFTLRTNGGIQLREGSVASSAGYLSFREETELGGTVEITAENDRWSRAEFEKGLTVVSTGKVTTQNERARLWVYGGLTNQGEVSLSSKNNIFGGATVNKGTITVATDGILDVDNMGYSVKNEGTLQVNGKVHADATVLVNTGTITGSGILYVGEDFDFEANYDSGIEYVDEGVSYDEETPAKYPRYKFVRDPAATVDATFFVGELSNQGEGTCTVTVEK